MKTKYFIFAASALVALASCSNDGFVGEDSQAFGAQENDGSIKFSYTMPQNATRADIAGNKAAELLGNNFYVTGTKGTEPGSSPTTTLVFDNYLVHYGVNTAGTTESNTANWEYVGVVPGTAPTANYDKLGSYQTGSGHAGQTIKYWDYSVDQYDFLAFSTGTFKAKKDKTVPSADEIGVTAMAYGGSLSGSGVAYTFYLPSETAVKDAYISDITEVVKANYGKEVVLKFKNLGSKVRVALYETVPGYSVKDVEFYTVDGTSDFSGAKGTDAALISDGGIPTKGSIAVYFPHVGTGNHGEADYDKASATVTPGTGPASVKTFGALTNQLVAKEFDEATGGNVYLGRTLSTASFAGVAAEKFYQTVFPVSSPKPLTLRVNYTLVPVDGAAETIVVKGAKAIVPDTYTKWLPNYAYTYIFKISDNTNGWTGTGSEPSGLFPITFDAVVTEATDATAEQKTITTVATPSITTYQQNHDITKDEYSIATAKNIYVQVMDNNASPAAVLVGETGSSLYKLNTQTADATDRSLLYDVTSSGAVISEATVMDALQNQSSATSSVITGRNAVVLTSKTIDATVTSIVNGANDDPITVTAGQAAEIAIGSLTADHTYAFVYDYSSAAKVETTIYQPIAVSVGNAVGSAITGTSKNSISTTDLDTYTAASNFTEDEGGVEGKGEAVSDTYIYFSKTKNGTSNWIYSYVSVDGKERVPAGLLKVAKTNLNDATSSTVAAEKTFYFNIYTRNTGKYAVKIIKIVA